MAEAKQAKRRLTIHPGQVSLVFRIELAESFFKIISKNVSNLPTCDQSMISEFLCKMKSAIDTGKRLDAKQSAINQGEFLKTK